MNFSALTDYELLRALDKSEDLSVIELSRRLGEKNDMDMYVMQKFNNLYEDYRGMDGWVPDCMEDAVEEACVFMGSLLKVRDRIHQVITTNKNKKLTLMLEEISDYCHE